MATKSVQSIVKYGEISGLTAADQAQASVLDASCDGYLDAGEIGKGLLSAQAPVVGRLFAAGLSGQQTGRPVGRTDQSSVARQLTATFMELNSVQQYGVLQRLSSPQQAALIHRFSKIAPRLDLHYLWFQFVFAESGVLGGIFLNHLQAANPSLAKTMPQEALNASAGEFRKQLQDHLKVALSVRREASSAAYFPSAEEARQFLKNQGTVEVKKLSPQLQTLVPYHRGPRPLGAVAVIHEGQGFILRPRPGFVPRFYEVEVAKGMTPEKLHEQYELGTRYLEADRHNEALQVYKKILEANPQEYLAYIRMGNVFNDLYNQDHLELYRKKVIQQYQLAIQGWNALQAKAPDYFQTHHVEAIYYEYAKDSIGILENEAP